MCAARLGAEYVLALRWTDDRGLDELVDYLARLREWMPVTVVDGSDADTYAWHAKRFPAGIRHLRPEPWPGRNGKVAGVMTGIRHARHDRVVLADDDVRYERASLERAVGLLSTADLVRPQNYFSPLPWHAAWDTARMLVNRCFGSDYPGTFALRRSVLLTAGGYNGDVLFENLELVRTMTAAGGRERRADDLFVRRLPPEASRFWEQRVRQAYDDFAQPGRLLAELALLPVIVWSVRRPQHLAALLGIVAAVAWRGRARAGGPSVFPARSVAFAPVWMLERAVCVWIAVGERMLGGARYGGRRIPAAGSPQRALRQRVAAGTAHG